MGQEYYLMKTFKIAAATAVLALASGYAVAVVPTSGNTSSVTGTAVYHLSKIITISVVNPLQFQDLVLPNLSGHTTYTTIDNDSVVGYGAGANPGTTTTVNTGSNTYVAKAAKFTITGEPDYQFSVSAEHTNPADVTLDLYKLTTAVAPVNATSSALALGTPSTVSTMVTSPLGNENLGGGGSKDIEFGGKLTAYYSATPSTDGSIDIAVTVTYN